MSGFQSPNHTQIPNDLFDVMLPDMGLAELKITLVALRKTLGWQKKRDKISLSQMCNLTGLSRQGVLDGAEAAEQRGTLRRINGKITVWVVNVLDSPKAHLVKPVDQSSQASRLELVKPVDTQKKVLNKELKKKPLGASAPTPSELKSLELLFSELTCLEVPSPTSDKERRATADSWWQPLRRINAACNGKSESILRTAVEQMQKDNLTIYAPRSIEKVAIALAAREKSHPAGQVGKVFTE